MRQRTMTMWVIFVGSKQVRGSGTQYVARDGSVTQSKNEAQKFSTAEAARDFAADKAIAIDGETRHLGQQTFTQTEIAWRPLVS